MFLNIYEESTFSLQTQEASIKIIQHNSTVLSDPVVLANIPMFKGTYHLSATAPVLLYRDGKIYDETDAYVFNKDDRLFHDNVAKSCRPGQTMDYVHIDAKWEGNKRLSG